MFPTILNREKWADVAIYFRSILNRPDLANYEYSAHKSRHQDYFVEAPCFMAIIKWKMNKIAYKYGKNVRERKKKGDCIRYVIFLFDSRQRNIT